MNRINIGEQAFEASVEADGGYSAERLTEDIFTQGDNRGELRANVREADSVYFFDSAQPQSIRLHLMRDEVVAL
jgi:hypothetical protein